MELLRTEFYGGHFMELWLSEDSQEVNCVYFKLTSFTIDEEGNKTWSGERVSLMKIPSSLISA